WKLLEKLQIRTARGQAKVAGTLFCIGGSLVFTFWKGGYLFKGCGLQSLHCSIIANHDDMPFPSLQSSFLALFFTRNPNSWRLEWNLQLLTIVYCGVVISALAYYLQTWCISYKGRVFAAMFSPLQIIIVALFSAIAFTERLHFGSLIGAFLIIVGLYCVLWGKRKDNLVAEQTENGKGVLEDIKVLEHDISVINPVTRERT
ncbi:unnamed protein product, partial [Prunus brigantina]